MMMVRGPLHPEMSGTEILGLALLYQTRIAQARLTLLGGLNALARSDMLELGTRLQLALNQLDVPKAQSVEASVEP